MEGVLCRATRPGGHPLWLSVTGSVVRDEHGKPDYLFLHVCHECEREVECR